MCCINNADSGTFVNVGYIPTVIALFMVIAVRSTAEETQCILILALQIAYIYRFVQRLQNFYHKLLRTDESVVSWLMCDYILIDQVFALTSCAYQALMSQFAKLPCMALTAADLQDSQLLSTYGK